MYPAVHMDKTKHILYLNAYPFRIEKQAVIRFGHRLLSLMALLR